MKIVDGIHRVEGVNGSVYLFEDADRLTLIDTGLPGSNEKIAQAILELGRQPADISTIIITHLHIDHVGSLKQMQELTGAKVAVHDLDADYVAGKRIAPKPKNLLLKTVTSGVNAEPVEVGIRLKENDAVGRLTIVHTPGHSEGSISLYDAERKVMFVGDAVKFKDGKITVPPEQFTLDPCAAEDSIRKIAAFDFDVMLSGHGEPLMPKASQRLREFAASLR